MNAIRFRRSSLATGLSAAVAATFLPSSGAAPLKVGGEFTVNSTTAGQQGFPAVASSATGATVAVWTTFNGGVASYDIAARRFNENGSPVGLDVTVNTQTSNVQSDPDVAMDAAGDYVVVWQNYDGSAIDVRAQRFGPSGVKKGGEIVVNTSPTGVSFYAIPRVAMSPDGDFVVAWAQYDGVSYDVKAQRFAADGTRAGINFTLSEQTANYQSSPVVGMDAEGRFVAAWADCPTISECHVRAQRFAVDGSRHGPELTADTSTTIDASGPAIAVEADGDFVVAWMSVDNYELDIHFRRFNSAGVAVTSELPANTVTTGNQNSPSIAIEADGDFAIAWQGYDAGLTDAHLQRFSASGAMRGAELTVNTSRNSHVQAGPHVASDADGDLLVAWLGEANGNDVLGQRYRTPEPVDLGLGVADLQDPVAWDQTPYRTYSISNLHPPVDLQVTDALQGAVGAATGVKVQIQNAAHATAWPTAANYTAGPDWRCTLNATTEILTCKAIAPILAGVTSKFTVTYAPGFDFEEVPGTQQSDSFLTATQFDPSTANNHVHTDTEVVCGPTSLRFTNANVTAGEAAGTANVSVTREGTGCGAVSIQYDTDAGSAVPGLDFIDTAGTLSWADGDTAPKSIPVALLDDNFDEVAEHLRLRLSHPVGATLGSPDEADLAITDDDAPPRVNFTASTKKVNEGAGIVTVTVQLSAVSGRNVNVPINHAGTATIDSDYFLGVTGVTIPTGSRTASFDLEIADDAVAAEGNETVRLTLGTPVGATKGSVAAYTLTVTDND